jgi:hypothetical protein
MEFVGCPTQTGGFWLFVRYRRSGDFLTLWGEKPVRTSLNPLALDKAPPTSKNDKHAIQVMLLSNPSANGSITLIVQ